MRFVPESSNPARPAVAPMPSNTLAGFALAVLAASFALTAPFEPALVAEPTASVDAGGAWIVAGVERPAAGSVTFARTVLVGPGATLVLEDAALVLETGLPCANVDGRLCAPGLLVEAGGKLVARRSTIEGLAASPVHFPIITIHGEAEIADTTFSRVGGVTITGPAARASLRDSTLANASGGVSANRGAVADLEGNTLEGYGFAVADSLTRLAGNTVRNATIAYRVSSTIVGMRCCRAVPTVEGNLAEGGELGFFVDSIERFSLAGNVVRGARYGFNVTAIPAPDSPAPSVPWIERARVEGALVAITLRSARPVGVLSTPEPALVELVVRDSDLSGACRGVVVDAAWGPQPVRADARWNWWGSTDGPRGPGACAGATGDVDVAPWLLGPP